MLINCKRKESPNRRFFSFTLGRLFLNEERRLHKNTPFNGLSSKGGTYQSLQVFFEPVDLLFRKVSFYFHILIEPLGILGLLHRRMVVVSHRCLPPHS